MSVKRIRKRPVEVEAIQWTGDNYEDILEFAGHRADRSTGTLRVWNIKEEQFIRVPKWHWVIKGVEGEFYPCDPGILFKTYEVAVSPGREDGKLYVIMTRPPGPDSQFVEVEDSRGQGVDLGKWVNLGPNRWALEIDDPR